jgi:hypothetical protein
MAYDVTQSRLVVSFYHRDSSKACSLEQFVDARLQYRQLSHHLAVEMLDSKFSARLNHSPDTWLRHIREADPRTLFATNKGYFTFHQFPAMAP